MKKTLVCLSVVGALMAMSNNAAASAFALIEQSSGLGNAFAGGAAAAEDATTIFFNPAGMSRLKGKQVTLAGSLIQPSAKFSNTGSTPAAGPRPLGGNGGDAGGLALVPNTYMMMELDPTLRLGLGINAPFGLQTEYDATWIGRFQAVKSRIETINLNPSVAYQVNDSVSLGLGLNYQHISGELTNAVNLGAAEGFSSVKGSDSSWGYNFGALFNVTPDTRIGLAYRSKVKYTLSGTVTFTGGVPAANGDVTLPITMPDSLSISGFHRLTDKWDLMADATRTGWSVLKQLQITRTSGAVLQTVPENWKDTWRVAVGASYHYNEQWLARIGAAYDHSPVPDAFRTARIPDNDRTWFSLGGQYKPSASGTIDFGYAHLVVKDASINQPTATSGSLVGTYSSSVDILSLQYAYNF